MATVTVCSKLPFDFKAEFGGTSVVFNGAKGVDVTGEPVLLEGYGMTPGVDSEWFEGWKKDAAEFPAVVNGVIFASAANKAQDEAKELAGEVKSGLEQKSADELGVEVSVKEK
ncbi:hypothetical protein [Novosphingobium olei]|uniref:Uncharacterized protein n=1 Tax=Novosphingobium olei TaxID=2728851 RepID=A0A7Y0BNW1_9SPHN|nr:hypothetical protein [Novosphingobium olei]NML93799.1 hypothetical protein [Novosphingobium olei]